MALFNYECDEVKHKIDEVSPNYPQLTTYEKEWLYFHQYVYIAGTPVALEYETVSVNPNGSVSNAIPFYYKSAILKGNTLVNLVGEKHFYTNNGTNAHLRGWEFMLPYNLTKGKTYLAVFNATGTISSKNSKVYLMDNNFHSDTGNTDYPVDFKVGYNIVKCVASGDNHRVLRIRTQVENSSQSFQVSDVMLIEYIEGMENWDIPYFEGTQSVQMPVLTTVGKNLYSANEDDYLNNHTINNKGELIKTTTGRTAVNKYIPVKPSTTYYFSINDTDSSMMAIYGYSEENESSFTSMIINPNIKNVKFTTGSNDNFIRIRYNLPKTTMISYQIQIEEGSVATSYEPYQSNILTVNEDVKLRGIGDVRDELDLLTGDVIQNVSEFVLDGNYSKMNIVSQSDDTGFIKLRVYDIPDMVLTNLPNSVDMMICDKFKHESLTYVISDLGGNPFTSGSPTQEYIVRHNGRKEVVIALSKDKAIDLETAKTWLQSNKVKLVYQRQEKSIKTVDLRPLNRPYEGTNHYELTSNIPCEAILEVPVVSAGKQTLEEINN